VRVPPVASAVALAAVRALKVFLSALGTEHFLTVTLPVSVPESFAQVNETAAFAAGARVTVAILTGTATVVTAAKTIIRRRMSFPF